MTAKPKLRSISQISNNEESALANLNANFQDIEKAITDSVSRSGLTPTNMQTSLDMGGNPIINIGGPIGPNDAVRRQDIQDLIDQLEVKQAEIDSLVQQAKNTITQYVAEEVIPPVLEGVDTTTANAAAAASSASSASASATTATTKAEEASDSASLSQAWAVADDFDTRLEGESSSKAYANLAMAIANTPEDTPVTMSDLQSRVILKGDPGESATVAVGTVTTLPAGSDATVTNVGTSEAAVFNFGIPQGADGDTAKQGKLITGQYHIKPSSWEKTITDGVTWYKAAVPVTGVYYASIVWVGPYPSMNYNKIWTECGVFCYLAANGVLYMHADKVPEYFTIVYIAGNLRES